jgi:hypothetical protein
MLLDNPDSYLKDLAVVGTFGGTEILILFDNEGLETELGLEGRKILATSKTSDVSTANHGDLIYIDSHPYEIIGIRPIMDGIFTELDLKDDV